MGLLGQPRRVFEYARNLQTLNDISSISAFLSAASFLIFIFNFVWSVYIDPVKAADNPWDSKGLEWQTATPVPWFDFERIPVVLSDPYHYGEPEAPPVADLGVGPLVKVGTVESPLESPGQLQSPSNQQVSRDAMADKTTSTESLPMLRETPEEIAYELSAHEGALWTGSRMVIGIWAFVRGPGVRLLLPAIGEQRRPVAPCPYHGAHRGRCRGVRLLLRERRPGRLRPAKVPIGLRARLAGRRLDRGSLHSDRSRTANLAADGTALLPWVQRVRIVLHRLGRNEHRTSTVGGLLARNTAGTPASPSSCRARRRGHGPFCPARREAVPRANLEGCTYFWVFIAFVALLFWTLFYVL